MSQTVSIHLKENVFGERETILAEYGDLVASAFRFDSGVCGLRLQNSRGELVLLPFQGQQIWSCTFDGRKLQMVSIFDQPRPSQNYLDTYGGFFLHCGATAMGVPGPQDDHPLHGELPNAPYETAHLEIGSDQRGAFIALGGAYLHRVAFSHHYRFEPLVKLYADQTVFPISARLTNLKRTPMEWMYMGHLNFRPLDGGRIVYSAPCTPAATRIFANVPEHARSGGDLDEAITFLEALVEDPSLHTRFSAGQFIPEAVFAIDYMTDNQGWAHSLQLHPDGYAHYVAHRPAQLPHGVRWIRRTPDEDALGLWLPATAEHGGYTAEKEKGFVGRLAAGESVAWQIEAGLMAPDEAETKAAAIEAILQTVGR
jgi:hypothetical protein